MKNTYKKIGLLNLFLTAILLISCGTEEEVLPDSLEITASATSVNVGTEITFSALSQNNGDVSSAAQFYVNGNALSGNTFTPTEAVDNNQVYATWSDLTSNTLSFASVQEVVIPSTYSKKVLVEDYTGTWCGYCPGMNNVLEALTEHSSHVVPVAIHCDNDPYQFELQSELQEEYNTTGLPKARVNRVHPLAFYVDPTTNMQDKCGINTDYYQSFIDDYLNQTAPLGLAINSSLSGTSLNFEVKIGFATENISNPKLVVYLLEDGLLHEQTNYFTQGTNFGESCQYVSLPYHIPNYEHNHVLMKAYTDIFGDEIPAEQISTTSIYSRTFDVQLPSSIEDNSHLSLVAFVLGGNDNDVQNVQYAHVGETQDFD